MQNNLKQDYYAVVVKTFDDANWILTKEGPCEYRAYTLLFTAIFSASPSTIDMSPMFSNFTVINQNVVSSSSVVTVAQVCDDARMHLADSRQAAAQRMYDYILANA